MNKNVNTYSQSAYARLKNVARERVNYLYKKGDLKYIFDKAEGKDLILDCEENDKKFNRPSHKRRIKR